MVQLEQKNGTQAVPHGQVGKSILRATGALMFIQVILRGFGLIEKSILGHVVGADFRTDAYNAAKDAAFYIFQIVDQVVMHSFLPVFVQRVRERGDKDAWRLASTAINILIVLVALVAITGIFFAPEFLHFLLPDWFKAGANTNSALVDLTIKLTRVMLLAVIFLASSSMTYCLLNSYKKFALPASADLALKGTVLVLAVLFMRTWGPYALAIGFLFGAAAKLGVHAVGLYLLRVPYRPVADLKHPGLKQFGLLALPLLAGVLVSIIRQIMDIRFTSSLTEGSLSALKYAKTLTDVPVAFFPFVFGIALFPFLADIAAAGDRERLRAMLMTATRMMVMIFLPLALIFILLREPIVVTLFSAKAIATTDPLQIYAIMMLVGALEIIVLQFYFAMSDTIRPTIVGMAMVPIHIGVAYVGVYHTSFGMIAIALALLISKGTKVIVLYGMIRNKLGDLEGGRTLALLGKVVIALLPMVSLLLAAVLFLPETAEVEGKVKKILVLFPYLAAGGVGMLVYFGMLHFLRVDEISLLLQKVRGKMAKKPVSA